MNRRWACRLWSVLLFCFFILAAQAVGLAQKTSPRPIEKTHGLTLSEGWSLQSSRQGGRQG